MPYENVIALVLLLLVLLVPVLKWARDKWMSGYALNVHLGPKTVKIHASTYDELILELRKHKDWSDVRLNQILAHDGELLVYLRAVGAWAILCRILGMHREDYLAQNIELEDWQFLSAALVSANTPEEVAFLVKKLKALKQQEQVAYYQTFRLMMEDKGAENLPESFEEFFTVGLEERIEEVRKSVQEGLVKAALKKLKELPAKLGIGSR